MIKKPSVEASDEKSTKRQIVPLFIPQVIEAGGRFESRFLPRWGYRMVDQQVLNPELGITPATGDTSAEKSRKSHFAANLFRRQNELDLKAEKPPIAKPKGVKKPREATLELCRLHAAGMRWRPALIAHFKATGQKLPSSSEATTIIGTARRYFSRHKAQFNR